MPQNPNSEAFSLLIRAIEEFSENTMPEYSTCPECSRQSLSRDLYAGVDAVNRCRNCHQQRHVTCSGCGQLAARAEGQISNDFICATCEPNCINCMHCNVRRHPHQSIALPRNGETVYVCGRDCERQVRRPCSCGNSHFLPFDPNRCPDKYPDLPVEYVECYLPNRTFAIELETTKKMDPPKGWTMIRDGSVAGMEYLTGPVLGQTGIDKIEAGCAILSEGKYVDETCGYHIHMNARDLEETVVANFIKLCYKYQNEVFALLPKSRRENRYCKLLPDNYGLVTSVEDVLYPHHRNYSSDENREIRENQKKEKYHPTRYFWLNVHSYYYRGTVEIRCHEGTLDSEVVLNWAELWLKILELCNKEDFSLPALEGVPLLDLMDRAGVRAETIDYYKRRESKYCVKKKSQVELVLDSSNSDGFETILRTRLRAPTSDWNPITGWARYEYLDSGAVASNGDLD